MSEAESDASQFPIESVVRTSLVVAVCGTAAIDFLHWHLNSRYEPYLGFGDSFMHAAITLSGFLYLVSFLYLLFYIVNHPLSRRIADFKTSISLALIVTLILEYIYMALFGDSEAIKVTSAPYTLMFPAYAGGVLPGLLLAGLAASTRRRPVAVFLTFSASLWIAGPFIIDTMFFGEGGARATGAFWQTPILSEVVRVYSMVFALGLFTSPFLILGGLVCLPILLKFRKSRDYNIPRFAVLFSTAFLGLQIMNWGGFIWD